MCIVDMERKRGGVETEVKLSNSQAGNGHGVFLTMLHTNIVSFLTCNTLKKNWKYILSK